MLKKKDMLGLIDTSAEEIDEILTLAAKMKEKGHFLVLYSRPCAESCMYSII